MASTGDPIGKFQSALIQVILTGTTDPQDVSLHGIPRILFDAVSESLLHLLEWRIRATSPKKEVHRSILKWIRKRLLAVLERNSDGQGTEFSRNDVEVEMIRLFEYLGTLTFSRILFENQATPHTLLTALSHASPSTFLLHFLRLVGAVSRSPGAPQLTQGHPYPAKIRTVSVPRSPDESPPPRPPSDTSVARDNPASVASCQLVASDKRARFR
ncbi:unnamed protein product [Caenorhabditis sp. 36 PRJEB53466]|nr:unnamed protein product [Caenorhabditis sp. 36 PRJEB53466]